MNSRKEYIEENMDIINKMIEVNCPKIEIARVLGIKISTLNKYFSELGIDYQVIRRGVRQSSKELSLARVLNGEVSMGASKLRGKLIEYGLKEEKCENCGLSEWMGEKIPLELHHKNMNHSDNRIDNLQILCSNCHSLMHKYSNSSSNHQRFDKELMNIYINKRTNGGFYELNKIDEEVKKLKESEKDEKKRIKKEREKRFCVNCGKELTSRQKKYCSQECSHEHISKRPSAIELFDKYKELNGNKVRLGQYYGVSDKAVKKWLRIYKIE